MGSYNESIFLLADLLDIVCVYIIEYGMKVSEKVYVQIRRSNIVPNPRIDGTCICKGYFYCMGCYNESIFLLADLLDIVCRSVVGRVVKVSEKVYVQKRRSNKVPNPGIDGTCICK